jgi:serine protease Do
MGYVAPFLEEKLFPTPVNEVHLTEESAIQTSDEIQPEDMILEAKNEPGREEEENETGDMLVDMAYVLRKVALECEQWMVQVAGVSSETSWLESTKTSANITAGAIVADNGTELLILVDKTNLEDADHIEVTFFDGEMVRGEPKGTDVYSEFMVIGVAKSDLIESTLQNYQIAKLGSSNRKSLTGTVVIALGNTNGTVGSVNYGFITGVGLEVSNWDNNYRLIRTDIYSSSKPNGFLVDLNGQILGVLSNDYNPADIKNLLTAVGISDLKKKIEKMSNADDIPIFGVKGTEVTQQAHTYNNIPYGAYVTSVKLNSPAMKAGIQAGDVIIKMDEKEIDSMLTFSYYLNQMKVGEQTSIIIMRQSQGIYKESTLKITLGSP